MDWKRGGQWFVEEFGRVENLEGELAGGLDSILNLSLHSLPFPFEFHDNAFLNSGFQSAVMFT